MSLGIARRVLVALFVVAAVLASSPAGNPVPPHSWKIRIASSGMEPTLHCAKPTPGCLAARADVVLVEAVPERTIRRGQVVGFRWPTAAVSACGLGPAGALTVKRVIGLPGERVSEVRGYVFVNGKRLAEPYISGDRRDRQTLRTVQIPAHSFFLVGDNRLQSCDSREWGALPWRAILGPMVRVIRS